MKHLGYLASALLAFSFVALSQTTVTDTIKTPVSQTNFAGTVQIIGPAITYDGVTYAKAARRIRVTNGAFSLVLVPNVGASPSGTSYAVRFTADEGISWDETWVVVASGSPVTIGSIRSTIPAPSTTIAFSQLPTCGEAEIIKFVSGAWACSATGAGTVSSVAISLPSELTVSGSPVTSSGTITAAWASQTANKILGSPDGTTGTPSFRALVAGDIPTLDAAKIGTGVLAIGRLASGTPDGTKFVRDDGTLAVPPGGITLASLSATAPLAYNNGTGVFSMPAAATGGVSGYLSGSDWGTFNGKENALTFSAPLDRSTNTISCLVASGSQAGCLSSTDWTTFNGKAAASHNHTATDINSGVLAIAQGGTGAATTSQNFAFIGPTSGSGAPSFRALVAGDVPNLDASKITAGTLGVARGGTGLTGGTSGGIPYYSDASTLASSGALTANLPVFGGGAGAAPIVGTRSGNTTQVVTTTGAQTAGDCVEIDASGNHVASGAACGTGGGGGTSGALVLIEEHTASTSATLDFTSCITSAYDEYEVHFKGLVPVTDATVLQLRMSSDGGSSYISTSIYSIGGYRSNAGGSVGFGANSTSQFNLGASQGNGATNAGYGGILRLYNPLSASRNKHVLLHATESLAAATGYSNITASGTMASSSAMDAFQVFFNTGNISVGSALCYGVAKTGSPGGGDLTGPASAVDDRIVTFDGTTGKLVQDSGKAIPTGDVVGTSDSQTLTAKTLTTPIVTSYTVAGLPAAGTAGRVAVVTDASTAGSCTSGGGSAVAFCRDSGAAWVPLGDGGGGGGGSGDVVGPASATDYALAIADGTTGKLIEFISSAGTSGQVLTSAGAGAAPAWTTRTTQAEVYWDTGAENATGGLYMAGGWKEVAGSVGVSSTPVSGAAIVLPDAATTSVMRVLYLPTNWDSTGTTSIEFNWSWGGAGGGSVVWQVETGCAALGETNSPTFNAAQTVTGTASNVTRWQGDLITLNSTSLTGCSAGERMHIKISRLGSDAADNITASVGLIGVLIKYTITL